MKKAQIPISSLILLLLGILILSLVVLPKYREWAQRKGENDKFNNFLQNYHNYLLEVEKTIGEIEAKGEDLEKIKTILPPDPFIAEYFFLLNQLSQNHGLVLFSFNYSLERSYFSPSGESTSLNAVPSTIEFLVRGNYSSIKDFLSALEKSARLSEVKEVEIKSELPPSPKEEKATTSLQINNAKVKVEIYSLPQK